jgi:hypothetical protein
MPMVDLVGDEQARAIGNITATSEDEAKRLINTKVRVEYPDYQPLWSRFYMILTPGEQWRDT